MVDSSAQTRVDNALEGTFENHSTSKECSGGAPKVQKGFKLSMDS